MDREEYIKKVYSKYWLDAREKKYGFKVYDKNLCGYIMKNVASGAKLLDVACGTGYPFGYYLDSKGYDVYGTDISFDLIEKGKKHYPNIEFKVATAENISYPDNFFDAVYCFHSSWYFSDLKKAVNEMIRVSKPAGLILIDIMNYHNESVKNQLKKEIDMNSKLSGKILKYFKNIAKIILRKGTVDWHFVTITNPTKPEEVKEFILKDKKIGKLDIFTVEKDESIKLQEKAGLYPDYGRLVFSFKK